MQAKILLNDLLHLSDEEIKLYKVKFNQPNREGTNPNFNFIYNASNNPIKSILRGY